jgi:putative ABC transport system substrate-binding protein
MRRRDIIALLGSAALAGPRPVAAQPADRPALIGVLMGFAESDPEARTRLTTLRQGLEALGWVEGRTCRLEIRYAAAGTDRLRDHAVELIGAKPALILAHTTPVLAALVKETRTIPLVFVQVSDPIGGGFVSSLAHPGGNVTGFTNLDPAMGGKWIEILKEIAPATNRIALLFNPDTAPSGGTYFLRAIEEAAPSFGMALTPLRVRTPGEIESALATFARPESGLLTMADIFTSSHRETIASLALRHRLPAVFPYRYFAEIGGLVSYGVDTPDLFYRAAAYVDRILKGTAPGELPIQQPTKFELVINLRTATALGLTIPTALIASADEVIE